MAYCRKCGSEINEYDTTCFECGERQNGDRRSDVMRCPRCESTNIQLLSKTEGSDYDVSNGCCGYILLGPLGLLCGLSSSKTTETVRVCATCKHEF